MSNESKIAPKKMGPLPKGHPCIGDICPGCKECIEIGEFVTLVAVGPGADPDERKRAREGRPYNGVGVVAHYACVTGETT